MKYIAYGSNMNLNQMRYRCPNSSVESIGYLTGWKLYFNIHADIKYTGNKKDIVPVVIWNIAKEDWQSLDLYEGYPNYYIKKVINTSFINNKGKTVKKEDCIAYIMSDDTINTYDRPSDSYIDTILVGYLQNNIDFDKLFEALDYSEKQRGRIVIRHFDSGAYSYNPYKKNKKNKKKTK